MKKGLLGAVAALLAGAGLANAQSPWGYSSGYGYPGPYGNQPMAYGYPAASGYGYQPMSYGNQTATGYSYPATPGYNYPATSGYSYPAAPGYSYPAASGYGYSTNQANSYPTNQQQQRSDYGTTATPVQSVAILPSASVPTPGATEATIAKWTQQPHDDAQLSPSCSGTLDDCCPAKGVCGPPGRFWVSAEFLLWWIKGGPVPPLVTTGPASPTTPPPGAIGTPGTVVLFGGNNVDPGTFLGGRFTAGFWLNECHTVGIEGSYFFLGSRSKDFTASSDGSIVLARPFFDVSSGLENSELDAFPGLASGNKTVSTSSQLQGAETNLLCNLCCSCNNPCDSCAPAHGYRVDLISGLRYLDLREKLRLEETSQVFPGATGTVLDGSTISAFDEFDTRNQFYGAQIGARAEVWRKRLFASLTGKVALGITQQTVDINGSTTIAFPGGPALVLPGDLLALSSNIGHYSHEQFSFVPEVGVNAGYQVTDKLRIFVGYNFLFWSGVERPGDAIDLRVNSTHVPTAPFFGVAPNGPQAPLFSFHNSDFWAQSLNLGLQLRF